MKIITRPPLGVKRPERLSELWFQHQSSQQLTVIAPQTYETIARQRARDMIDIKEYISGRRQEEDAYRLSLGSVDDSMSFTYATITGFNYMENPTDYPGFTYFFKIKPSQVENTLFGLVAGDEQFNIEPERGLSALERCLSQWLISADLLHQIEDPIVGTIDPRIEVVISYPVVPELVIPEIEQR